MAIILPVDFRFGVQDNASGAVAGLEGSMSKLSSAVTVAAGVMLRDFARDAMNAVFSSAGQASEAVQEYELTLTRTAAASGAVGDEAKTVIESLRSVSEAQTDLGYSGREASAALEALVKAGMSSSEAADALTASLSLARLEGISTEEAAAYLVQTLTQFHLKATDAYDALNLISKAADAGIGTAADYAAGLSNAGASAANMGISLNETLAALVILDKTFGSATESGTFLNMLFKDLIAKSDDLSINLYNADGSMKSLDEIIQQIKTNVAAYGDNQQAVNEYLSVFDVRAQRAVLGLINYDGSIGDVITSMGEQVDVQDKVNAVMDTAAGHMAKVQSEIENTSYELGTMTAELTLAWKEFALGLGPIGAVADALGPALLQGALNGLIIMLPTLIKGINELGVSNTNLALGVTGAVTAFLGITALLNTLPDETRQIAAYIAIITGALVAVATAAAVAWGSLSLGTAVPVILTAIGVAAAGVTVALQDAGVAADEYSGQMDNARVTTQQFAATLKAETDAALTELESNLRSEVSTIESTFNAMVRIENESYAEMAEDLRDSYDEQLSDMQTAYDTQIDETRTFYDTLIGEIRAGLSDIRAERKAELADHERNYLLQKQALEAALKAQQITQEEFNKRMKGLEDKYRMDRNDISEDWRIRELTYEQDHRGEIETLEAEKNSKLTALNKQKNSDLTALENEKNSKIEALENAHKAELERLEQEMNAKINAAVEKAAAEKLAIVKDSYDKWIKELKDRLEELGNTPLPNPITEPSEPNPGEIYVPAEPGGGYTEQQVLSWASQAFQIEFGESQLNPYYTPVQWFAYASQAFNDVLSQYGYPEMTYAEINDLMASWMSGGGGGGYTFSFAEGGVAEKPTFALVGEKEREYMVPESKADTFALSRLMSRMPAAPSIQVKVDVHGNTFASDLDVERVFEEAGEKMAKKLQAKGILTVY